MHLELSACILKHYGTFWNILEHYACILEHSGTCKYQLTTHRQTLGLVGLHLRSQKIVYFCDKHSCEHCVTVSSIAYTLIASLSYKECFHFFSQITNNSGDD